MKKAILVIVISVLGFVNMNAQDIKFGVKGGINFASINGDNTKNIETVTSFNFGIMAEMIISGKFSFQPELMYSGQGYDIENKMVELTYLNMPLMAKYYVTKGLSLEAGPQIGFLLSAKKESIDLKNQLKKVDLGVNIGIGYKLDNGLNFGLRYNLGLSNMNNVDGITAKNKNSVLQLSVGYFFF